MKKGLLGIALAVMAVAASASALEVDVRLAPLGRSYPPPPIVRNQGWLSVSNRDWQPYTVVIEKKGRASLYQGSQNYPGMQCVTIPSGSTMILALEKDTWEFRGNTDTKLKVKVREGRTSTLSLEPYGPAGNSGLRGITNDGDKVRNEILFQSYYEPPVIVRQPTVVVHRPPPPPPPIIVQRPPVIVAPPPHHRPPSHHRRPPPPPRHDDGWNFSFGFSSGR